MASVHDLADFRFRLRTFLSFSEAACKAAGVSPQHYQLMQAIETVPERLQSSISYLANRMILRHNGMVELVDRAERAGLVRREDDERDMRRSLVQVTPRGKARPEELVAKHLNKLDIHGGSIIIALRQICT